MTLDTFFRAHLEKIKGWALYLNQYDKDKADDLVSEVSEKLVMNFHKYQDLNSPEAWLATVTRNTFINQKRKEGRGKQGKSSVASISYDSIEGFDPGDDGYQAEHDFDVASCGGEHMLMNIINDLPTRKRIVMLERIEGEFFHTIEAKHGINSATARSSFFNGRKEVVEKLILALPKEDIQEMASTIPRIKKIILRDTKLKEKIYGN